MNHLATEDNFNRYLNPNFIYTYLQFRLKYFIHEKMQSLEYRKHKLAWDGFLVGLEEAYITGLARIVLPLAKNDRGVQRYPSQIAIQTWLPNFRIKNKEHERYLKDWRDKAFAHIDIKKEGRTDKKIMSSIIQETIEAMAQISRTYKPEYEYKSDFEKLGEQAEGDFLRLLEAIKRS